MEDDARSRAIYDMVGRMLAGCDESEYMKMRCPVCGAPLELSMHPNKDGFSLFCTVSGVHMGATRGIQSPPEWWDKYITDDWLD